MNFLVPAFLGAAALVGLPVLLHLLRLQPPRRIPFPSLRFLGREALRDSNAHRIRRWLTFLLRCLAIALIVAAFARPFWPLEHSLENSAVVVVIDNSYSMQARGRREAIEQWLAPQIAALRRPDQLGVLLLHPTPTWLAPLGEDLDAGRKALKSLPTSWEVTRYRAGIELAAAKLALSTAKNKVLILAVDHQRLGWSGVRFERPLPPGIQLHAPPPASAPARQAAIVGFKASRAGEGHLALEAAVRGYTDNDEREVTFWSGDTKLGSGRTLLNRGRTEVIAADCSLPDPLGAVMLHATIDTDDLAVDDVAYAALSATDDRRVLLAGSPDPAEVDYLAVALRAVNTPNAGGQPAPAPPPTNPTAGRAGAPGLAVFRVEPLPVDRAWAPSSVAVLRGPGPFRPSTAPITDAFLAAGGSAWLICDGSAEQTAWLATHGLTLTPAKRPTSEKLRWRDLALEHPLFAPFAGYSIAPLLTPTFLRGWSIDGAAVEPLARWPDRSVAIAEVPMGAGRLLVTCFRNVRADSTFPTEPGFVPFVHQAVTWLSQNPMAAPVGGKVGEIMPLPGAGVWRAIRTPRPVATVEVNSWVVASVPGLYAFEQPDTPTRYYAVNVDTSESDLTPWATPDDIQKLVNTEPPPPPVVVQAPNTERAVIDESLIEERQAWWWLLVAAIGVLIAELALSNRTIP